MSKPILRTQIPSSRARIFSRLAPLDIIWAGVSPILAFLIRDGAIYRPDSVAVYCLVALGASVIAFQWFKISSPIPSLFSGDDIVAVVKACLTTTALTTVFLFVFTRLDDAPRSIPIIHSMVLGAGLMAFRALHVLKDRAGSERSSGRQYQKTQYVIVIGATRLAWYFCKMTEEFSIGRRQIVAILDENRSLQNRTLHGYSIIGSPGSLVKVIDEYATHGIEIDKVVVTQNPKELIPSNWIEVSHACKSKGIVIELLHDQFPFAQTPTSDSFEGVSDNALEDILSKGSYWRIKRATDVVLALAMIVVLAPLIVMVAALVLANVGSPVVFWQRRIGHLGQPFHLYKFRTMLSPINRKGQLRPDSERMSLLGRLLRRTRLDELPQLLNILNGDMSVVGPRPLLPVDQPQNVGRRLEVRPGLTGLAQINGGILLSPEEKDAVDQWYVHHATFMLDIKIILETAWMVLRGDRRNEAQIKAAIAESKSFEICTKRAMQ